MKNNKVGLLVASFLVVLATVVLIGGGSASKSQTAAGIQAPITSYNSISGVNTISPSINGYASITQPSSIGQATVNTGIGGTQTDKPGASSSSTGGLSGGTGGVISNPSVDNIWFGAATYGKNGVCSFKMSDGGSGSVVDTGWYSSYGSGIHGPCHYNSYGSLNPNQGPIKFPQVPPSGIPPGVTFSKVCTGNCVATYSTKDNTCSVLVYVDDGHGGKKATWVSGTYTLISGTYANGTHGPCHYDDSVIPIGGGNPPVLVSSAIQFGMIGNADVKKVQVVLASLNLTDTVNGNFLSGTKAAIEKFQSNNGLPVTGTVDSATNMALLQAAASQYLNLGISTPYVQQAQSGSTVGGF